MKILLLKFIFLAILSEIYSFQCGIKKVKVSGSLINGGQLSYAGQWPWLVSLHRYSKGPSERSAYFCGSSIINEWTLLTAAHCVTDTMTQNIFALLGRYDLKEEGEKNWLRREIAERKPHEEYKYWDLEHSKADADIAVLIMSESVTFTNYIQPICLPTPKDYVFDVSGVIVGYGKPDPYTEHLNTPQFLTMTSVNLTTCLFSNKQSLHTVSPRSFCARSKHGTACLGDSGGGFIKQLQGKWVILGIISHGLDAECSPDDFITFARVNYFLEWLEKNQKKFEGIPVTTRRPTTTAFKPTQTIPTIKTSKPTVAPKKDFFSFSDGELSRVRKPTFQEDFKGTTRSPIKPPQKIRLDNKVYPYDPENTEIIFAPMINFYNDVTTTTRAPLKRPTKRNY